MLIWNNKDKVEEQTKQLDAIQKFIRLIQIIQLLLMKLPQWWWRGKQREIIIKNICM